MSKSTNKVLLVGWDAADWKIINPLIENGELPVFSRLIDGGVMGDMATLEPVLSPLLWNSVATGKRADVHGILGFTEVDEGGGTGAARVRPVTSTSRRCKALWNILSQEGLRTNVVGWFGSHPAEPIRGACVSDAFVRAFPQDLDSWPVIQGTVFPDKLTETIRHLRVHPAEVDGEILRLFVPRLAEIEMDKPNRIPALCRVLAECFSTHAAATYLMEREPWDFMAVYYIGLDHFSHSFMNFHPPKLPWVAESDFSLYSEVVRGGYRLMDLFLARLLELAGPDTTVMVVSDHGFHSDHLRPRYIPDVPAGPCMQHRNLGIFALNGRGIRRDERIYGVNLLDVAPTVLALFGLKAGADMPGRVLSEAFDEPPGLERLPSWEDVAGDSGMHSGAFEMEQEDADALIDQFVALGYLDEPKKDREQAAADCRRERNWNLARVYMSTRRFAEALPLLEEIHAEAPDRSDFALSLADCQRRVGLLEDAAETVEEVIREHRETPTARFVLGSIALEQGRVRESLEHFLAAREAEPGRAELESRIGFALLKLRKWEEAARAFGRALEHDPHDPLSHQGLGLARMRQRRLEEAAQALLTSIGLQHDVPQSHYWLGVCLVLLGRKERARQAFETALSFQPPLRAAHRWLATLSETEEQGRFHREAAREFFRLRREEARRIEAVRQEARHRAIDRAERSGSKGGERAARRERADEPALSLTIVSGLPRSGTSLMMQMLAAAGLPVLTDGARGADTHNPEGYFEWAAIRRVGKEPGVLREAGGKAIKVISMLLGALPRRHEYKVIFMNRPIEEVFASQQKMLRDGGAKSKAERERMMELLAHHRSEVLRGMAASKRFRVLVVEYPGLIRNPEEWIPRIAEFLGDVPDAQAMTGVLRPELYRNRT